MSNSGDLTNFALKANAIYNSVSSNATHVTSLTVGNTVINTTSFNVGSSMNLSSFNAGNSSVNLSINSTSIAINGSVGANNQVLASNGSATYWANSSFVGATGAGNDKVFWQNNTAVTADYTIPANVNAGTFGPVSIGNNVTVTISNTATWTIV